MAALSTSSRDGSRNGFFEYMAPAAQASLYCNGKVLTRRDRNGSDGGQVGFDLVSRQMLVRDGRGLVASERRRLEENGFELLSAPLESPAPDFFDHHQVVRDYYPNCAEIVREATGAGHVVAFDHNMRSAAGKQSRKRIKGGQQVQGPSRVVHGDYTLTSAPQRLRDLTKPPSSNDTVRSVLPDEQSLLATDAVERALTQGRFAIINLWRNIADKPVAKHPLALCDATSVRPEDLVVFEIHYHDRIGENYFAKHADAHAWFFYPAVARNEALLIKQWESAGALAQSNGAMPDASSLDTPCSFSFHTAFEDPTTRPDAPERWSIEVRCIALYE